MAKKKVMVQDPRYAVVVVGMHRSGTSALGGVLARLGCDTPQDPIEAAPMNAKGFYESNKIVLMNDAILHSAGSTWFTWQEFNQAWFKSPKATDYKQLAVANLKEVYGDSSMLVLKDPRICLLVPFWDNVFEMADYTPKYIHTHRHPFEVAQSLSKWWGYDPAYSQLLWLRYVLDSESATRGKVRYFTSFDNVMQDWPNVAQQASKTLDLVWPKKSDRTISEIDQFLDSNLRSVGAQNVQMMGDRRLTPWVAETFDILTRWAEGGELSDDYDALDQIRDQFNRAAPSFSPAVENGHRDALSLQVKHQEEEALLARLESTQAEKASVEARLETAQIELDTVNAAFSEAESARVELTHRSAGLESALAQRSLEAEEVGHQLEAAKARIHDMEAALALAQEYAGTLADDAKQRDERLVAAEQQVAFLTRDLHASRAERDGFMRDLRNEKIRIEQEMRDQLVSGLRGVRERADAEVAGSQKEQKKALAEAASLQKEQRKALAELASLQKEQKKALHRQQETEKQLERSAGLQRDLQRQLQQQTELNRAAEQKIHALMTSTSWRLAGPLRRIVRAYRGARGKS